MTKLNTWQEAWLSAHPNRTAEWLKERARDGFDIHHLDGDKSNNDPLNLVLIESRDHLRLHNGTLKMSRLARSNAMRPKTADTEKKKFGTDEQIAEWQAAATKWREENGTVRRAAR